MCQEYFWDRVVEGVPQKIIFRYVSEEPVEDNRSSVLQSGLGDVEKIRLS